MTGLRDPRRALPSVDHLLSQPAGESGAARWGREAMVDALRTVLEEARRALAGSTETDAVVTDADRLLRSAASLLERSAAPGLRPVLNGTGVVLHTNLGRAPLPLAALANIERVGRGYANLEYDLLAGGRGGRDLHCVRRICDFTGSPDAIVVNNTAAAVALVVNGLANRGHVVASRGELVEIGGSFRLPGIVSASGGVLVEVGTTNRTRAGDYRDAIGPETAFLLKVHRSNFRIEGFTEEVTLEELVSIGREAGIPVVHDLGSGFLLSGRVPGLPPEPAPRDSVTAGADLTLWSGDKLLGGPQAGIIHGNSDLIERLRSSPLRRAFRVDKLTLAALEATLALYENPERALRTVPALARLSEAPQNVARRAERARERVDEAVRPLVRVASMDSLVGGGTFPGAVIESAGWKLDVPARWMDATCRSAPKPLIGRIENDQFLVDFRTLAPGEEEEEAASIVSRALLDRRNQELSR
ncbi:MAG: L-seryl-tRNA(Sec) selenium transferase [Gemmatimonadota bacterium]